MRVAVSDRLRELIRELARDRSFSSPEAVVEAALWGLDGPAVQELPPMSLSDAVRRPESSKVTYSADEVSAHLRAYIEERARDLDAWHQDRAVPAAISLGPEATTHVDVFIRAGVYASPEEAVEAALAAAVELNPAGTLELFSRDWPLALA